MKTAVPQTEDGLTTTSRLEAFSDGVFAIAITLLILEIRLPETGDRPLASALFAVWPSYFAYVLSFLLIGIYWVNHNYVFRIYQRCDHVFYLLNVLFLMSIAFLPFPTAVLGDHMLEVADRKTAIAFYVLGLSFPAVTWLLGWLYATRNGRLIDRRLAPGFIRHLTRQYLMSFVVFAIAFFVALLHPSTGLAISTGLTLLYLLPSRRPVYRENVESRSEG